VNTDFIIIILPQWKPRDAAVNFDRYRNLQPHRGVLPAIARLSCQYIHVSISHRQCPLPTANWPNSFVCDLKNLSDRYAVVGRGHDWMNFRREIVNSIPFATNRTSVFQRHRTYCYVVARFTCQQTVINPSSITLDTVWGSADKLLLCRARHWYCRPKPLVLAPLLSGTLSHLTVDHVNFSVAYFCPYVKDGTVWHCLLHLYP